MAEQSLLRIGELSRQTGVSTDLLRQWERRYGLLEPRRTSGGFRLYTLEDVARVRLMRHYVDRHIGAAEAAQLVCAASGATPVDHPGVPAGDVRAALRVLHRALGEYDDAAADVVLARLLRTFSPVLVLRDVVLPFMHELGERWAGGTASVAQEHFATQFFETRVRGLADGWGRREDPCVVTACPAGERHQLGLLVFSVALRHAGCRVTFLGADTPLEGIAQAAERTAAQAVVLASVAPGPLRAAVGPLGAQGHRVLLGGAGAEAAVGDAGTAATLLPDDPVRAAGLVAAATAEPDGGGDAPHPPDAAAP